VNLHSNIAVSSKPALQAVRFETTAIGVATGTVFILGTHPLGTEPFAIVAAGNTTIQLHSNCKCVDESPLKIVPYRPSAAASASILGFLDNVAEKELPMPDWSHLESPPSQAVRAFATTIKHLLAAKNLYPDRIVPSADGEISYYFFVEEDDSQCSHHRRFASITCAEDDTLVLLVADRSQDFSEATEFSMQPESMDAALDTLTKFIEPCRAL